MFQSNRNDQLPQQDRGNDAPPPPEKNRQV